MISRILCDGMISLAFATVVSYFHFSCSFLPGNWNVCLSQIGITSCCTNKYGNIFERPLVTFEQERSLKTMKKRATAHDNDEGDMAPVKYYFYFIPKNTLLISHKKNSKNSDICIMWHSDSLTVIKAQNFLW